MVSKRDAVAIDPIIAWLTDSSIELVSSCLMSVLFSSLRSNEDAGGSFFQSYFEDVSFFGKLHWRNNATTKCTVTICMCSTWNNGLWYTSSTCIYFADVSVFRL